MLNVFFFILFICYAIDRVHILEDRSLRLENVGLDDIGSYTCEADNAVGAVASTGNLIVYGMCIDFLGNKSIWIF